MTKHFIINRSDALGDLILTMPMAQALKTHFPTCRVRFIAKNNFEDLFSNHPYIDCRLNPVASVSYWYREFKKYPFKETYFFQVGGLTAPMMGAYLARIPFRGGIMSRLPSFLFLNEGIRQSRTGGGFHETQYNLQLLEKLKVHQMTNFAFPKPQVKKENYIFIHPGASSHSMHWPVQHYRSLCTLLQDNKIPFRIGFGPQDQNFISHFSEFKENLEIGSGRLIDYMKLIAAAKIYIGGSTGPTHLAGAMDVPLIAFYSPLLPQRKERWKPLGTKQFIFTPIKSMDEITPKNVFEKILEYNRLFDADIL